MAIDSKEKIMDWRVDLGDGYWYDNEPDYQGLSEENIKKIEQSRNCHYVCEWYTNTSDGKKVMDVAAIFWTDTPHPRGSNWLGLYRANGDWMVKDGITASQIPIRCVVSNDKQLVFSKGRHDFRGTKDGSVAIDGGRDYTRVLGNIRCENKWLVPYQGELKIIPDTMAKLMLEGHND